MGEGIEVGLSNLPSTERPIPPAATTNPTNMDTRPVETTAEQPHQDLGELASHGLPQIIDNSQVVATDESASPNSQVTQQETPAPQTEQRTLIQNMISLRDEMGTLLQTMQAQDLLPSSMQQAMRDYITAFVKEHAAAQDGLRTFLNDYMKSEADVAKIGDIFAQLKRQSANVIADEFPGITDDARAKIIAFRLFGIVPNVTKDEYGNWIVS